MLNENSLAQLCIKLNCEKLRSGFIFCRLSDSKSYINESSVLDLISFYSMSQIGSLVRVICTTFNLVCQLWA